MTSKLAPLAFVGLGANLGDRLGNLRGAARSLAGRSGIERLETSPVYETEAHTLRPGESAPPYLNAVARFRTTLPSEALLDTCQAVEHEAGRNRDREERWSARPLDLDVLAMGRLQCQSERLTLPHPRLAERRFVLRPWADLAPHFWVPPPFDAEVADLRARCTDEHALRRIDEALLEV